MQQPTLKTAIATYPHTRALKDGTVKPDDFSFDFVEVSPIIAAFRRMIRTMEFDISEMAISTYLCARAYNKPITAIPIFPLRAFHHGGIVINTKSGVKEPKDLEGKRVGVRAYTVTGGLWVRGILQSEYGVDPNKITWVVADEEHVQEYPLPKNVETRPGADLAAMLVAGELAGAIGVGRVDSPDVKPLIPNARAAAVDYAKRTGAYPINHTLVIQDKVLQAHPEVAADLFDAYKQAKQVALDAINRGEGEAAEQELKKTGEELGGDPLPYGVEANRKALETVIRFNVEQGIIPKPVKVEEIFDKSTLSLS
jgi:4,5-dihydroxyphthalate decarboxylase